MRRILFIFLLFAGALCVSAQTLKVTKPLTCSPNASVMALYQNEFKITERTDLYNRNKDIPFPYTLIIMHLEGTGTEVRAAKQILQLYLGQSYEVAAQYNNKENEILFLIDYQVKNVYITCGDGCERQLLGEGQQFEYDRVYECTVHYSPEEKETDEKGFVEWLLSPREVVNQMSITIVSNTGKTVYSGKVVNEDSELKFKQYSLDLPYQYTITAPFYAAYTDTFRIQKKTGTKISIQLTESYNSIQIQSPTRDPIFYRIDNENVTYNSSNNQKMDKLEAGPHKLHCQLNQHEDLDTTIFLNGDLSVKTFTPVMTHSQGELQILANISNSKVYVDGTYWGETPLSKKSFLTGRHTVNVLRDGYVPIEEEVVIDRNQTTIKEITLVAQAQVVLSTSLTTAKLAISSNNSASGFRNLPTTDGTWSGPLQVGTYYVKASAPDYNDEISEITVSSNGTYTINPPEHQKGYINISVRPSNAEVKVDGEWVGLSHIRVNTGSHTISARKNGYTSSGDKVVTVYNNSTTDVEMNLTSDWVHGEDEHPDHYLEALYGNGVQNNFSHYVGLTYGYMPKRFGFNLSGMYGINTNEFLMTFGPSIRLTNFDSPLSLQLGLGAGGVFCPNAQNGQKFTWAADAGLRFGFEPDNNFAWYSFNLGVKYFNKQFVPTASVSLMPIRWLCLLSYIDSEHPAHRIETVAGYSFKSKDWRVGINYSWNQTALGLYTQMLFGWKNNYSITAGPTFRLTPDTYGFDLQLYQGIGWYRDGGDLLGGETGIRMGFGENTGSNFGWWSLNAAFEYAQNKYYGINFGISLMPIGLLAMIGNDYSDLPAHRIETMVGYGFDSGAIKMGVNYSWNQAVWGVYTQFMVGLDENASITIGPTIRLTPNASVFDLQLYQGVGWIMDGEHMIGGETGIRLAFSNKGGSNFGWWSLNTAFEYGQNGYYGINCGVSLGILGTAGLAAGAIGAAVFLL